MHSISDALTSLREHFGFADFREGQREVLTTVLESKDAVVVMPTGSGKPLCYQLPAVIFGGVGAVAETSNAKYSLTFQRWHSTICQAVSRKWSSTPLHKVRGTPAVVGLYVPLGFQESLVGAV